MKSTAPVESSLVARAVQQVQHLDRLRASSKKRLLTNLVQLQSQLRGTSLSEANQRRYQLLQQQIGTFFQTFNGCLTNTLPLQFHVKRYFEDCLSYE